MLSLACGEYFLALRRGGCTCGPWSWLSRNVPKTRLRVTRDPPSASSSKHIAARGMLKKRLPSMVAAPDNAPK